MSTNYVRQFNGANNMRHMNKACDTYLCSADALTAFSTPQRSSLYMEMATLQTSPNLWNMRAAKDHTWQHLNQHEIKILSQG